MFSTVPGRVQQRQHGFDNSQPVGSAFFQTGSMRRAEPRVTIVTCVTAFGSAAACRCGPGSSDRRSVYGSAFGNPRGSGPGRRSQSGAS